MPLSSSSRRSAGVLATGCAFALLVGFPASAAGPKQNITTGTGIFDFGAKVHINAKSDADTTTDARGRFTLSDTRPGLAGELEGRVTCLRVVGERSVAGGVIERSTVAVAPAGTGFLQYTEDNGSPGDTDRSHTAFVAVPPTDCPDPVEPVFEVTNGNYVVKQAAAQP